MTCTQCESDTAEMETVVVYGGLIYCNWDCLAEAYVEYEVAPSPEQVEENAEVKEQ